MFKFTGMVNKAVSYLILDFLAWILQHSPVVFDRDTVGSNRFRYVVYQLDPERLSGFNAHRWSHDVFVALRVRASPVGVIEQWKGPNRRDELVIDVTTRAWIRALDEICSSTMSRREGK
jgi:hypothetical protein